MKRVVLDTDIGDDIDDAYALALALASPRIELAAVLTSGGRAPERARIARRLIRLAGRDVPVFRGIDAGHEGALHYRFEDEAGDGRAGEPARGAAEPPVPGFDGAVAAVRAALRDGGATLVCIGGLSNAARLLDALEPDERRRLEIVAMGGSFARGYDGAAVATPEANITRDAAAARRVLAGDAAVTLAPLDATWDLVPDAERLRIAHAPDSPLGSTLARLYGQWRRAYGFPHPVLHDPLALALAVDASLARVETFPVDVDDAGRTRRARSGPPCRVALECDRDAFMQWFEETLLAPAGAAR